MRFDEYMLKMLFKTKSYDKWNHLRKELDRYDNKLTSSGFYNYYIFVYEKHILFYKGKALVDELLYQKEKI